MLAAVDQRRDDAPGRRARRDGRDGELRGARSRTVDTRPALSADALRVQLLERLAPETTVLARAQGARRRARGHLDAARPARAGRRPSRASTSRCTTGSSRSRRRCSCPGVERVEADGVALLETTPRVIEAYMAGLNHELSRELLWREFPAALTGTRVPPVLGRQRPARRPGGARRHPADRRVGRRAARAGTCAAATGQLVLLVRGELLRRYPTTTIYAARATADRRRSTRRPGWRRCSAARSRRTSCSSASRSARRTRSASTRPARAGTSCSRSTRASRASASTRSRVPGVPDDAGRARLGARAGHAPPATPT